MKGQKPQTDSIYQKKSFNTYGDIELDTCRENILPNGYDVNQKVRFTEDVVQPEFMDYMNDWAKRLEKKGAVVWYRYCPVINCLWKIWMTWQHMMYFCVRNWIFLL